MDSERYTLRFVNSENVVAVTEEFEMPFTAPNDQEAIEEAIAQMGFCECEGSIPYDERWAEVFGALYHKGERIWSDCVVMDY